MNCILQTANYNPFAGTNPGRYPWGAKIMKTKRAKTPSFGQYLPLQNMKPRIDNADCDTGSLKPPPAHLSKWHKTAVHPGEEDEIHSCNYLRTPREGWREGGTCGKSGGKPKMYEAILSPPLKGANRVRLGANGAKCFLKLRHLCKWHYQCVFATPPLGASSLTSKET